MTPIGSRHNFEWTDLDGTVRTGRNQLTEQKERELREHVKTCPKKVERCKDCWLLYWNIGTETWNQIMRTL